MILSFRMIQWPAIMFIELFQNSLDTIKLINNFTTRQCALPLLSEIRYLQARQVNDQTCPRKPVDCN